MHAMISRVMCRIAICVLHPTSSIPSHCQTIPMLQTCWILFSVSTVVTAMWMSPCVNPSVTLARELRSKLSVIRPPLLVSIFFQSTAFMYSVHVHGTCTCAPCSTAELTHSRSIVWSGQHDNSLVHTTEGFCLCI